MSHFQTIILTGGILYCSSAILGLNDKKLCCKTGLVKLIFILYCCRCFFDFSITFNVIYGVGHLHEIYYAFSMNRLKRFRKIFRLRDFADTVSGGSRAGNSLISFPSESLVFCPKMSDLSKSLIVAHFGEWPEWFAHIAHFGERPKRFANIAHFWCATWAIH